MQATDAGAEFRIYGPLTADLSFRYNAGLTNLYKGGTTTDIAPVSYTVADGQQVLPLCDYFKTSKLSMISLQLARIYRF